MNLFLETRSLTDAREDHLTCFVAAALETDALFRTAYAEVVLSPLSLTNDPPQIERVSTQVAFHEQRSVPDMMLTLSDGRHVAVEHKIEASESLIVPDEGEPAEQLRRYLRIPDVAAVAYFRASTRWPPDDVLEHPRYLRPTAAPHFLWRDLYPALTTGDQLLTRWLREGFESLGFTPPLAHIGELVSDDPLASHEAQVNFGKLWDRTKEHLSDTWTYERGTSSTLFLMPRGPSSVDTIMLFPKASKGTLLRIRVKVKSGRPDETLNEIWRRLEGLGPTLPVPAAPKISRLSNGTRAVDLESSLHLILGDSTDAETHGERLLAQVAPVADALLDL